MTTWTKLLKCMAAGVLVIGTTSVFAGRTTVYEGTDFQGHYITTDNSMAIVGSPAFSNAGSSVVVSEGVWEACTDANFRGRCARLPPGQYPEVSSILNGNIASLRQVDFTTSAPPVVVTQQATAQQGTISPQAVVVNPALVIVNPSVAASPTPVVPAAVAATAQSVVISPAPAVVAPPAAVIVNPPPVLASPPQVVTGTPPPTTGRIVLYEYPNFGGGWAVVERGPAKDLDWANFSYGHRATSVRVESGTWMLCSEMTFRGECRTLGPGEYPQLSGALVGGVASARQVWQPEYGAFKLNTR